MYRMRANETPGYWTVEEFISNEFCGAWHALFSSSHDVCTAFIRKGVMP